ncbi:hypothetical protein HDU96_005372, partial [Phlyctochytrium bullatum]
VEETADKAGVGELLRIQAAVWGWAGGCGEGGSGFHRRVRGIVNGGALEAFRKFLDVLALGELEAGGGGGDLDAEAVGDGAKELQRQAGGQGGFDLIQEGGVGASEEKVVHVDGKDANIGITTEDVNAGVGTRRDKAKLAEDAVEVLVPEMGRLA